MTMSPLYHSLTILLLIVLISSLTSQAGSAESATLNHDDSSSFAPILSLGSLSHPPSSLAEYNQRIVTIYEGALKMANRSFYAVDGLERFDELVRENAARVTDKQRTKPLLLDIGSGSGYVIQLLAQNQLLNRFGEIHGVDLVPGFTEMAQNGTSNVSSTSIHFTVGDAHNLESLFPESYFDIITCRNALHEWRDADQVLTQLKRVLKPQGKIVFLDMINDSTEDLTTLIYHTRHGSMVSVRSESDLMQLFERNGLESEEIERSNVELNFDEWAPLLRTVSPQHIGILSKHFIMEIYGAPQMQMTGFFPFYKKSTNPLTGEEWDQLHIKQDYVSFVASKDHRRVVRTEEL
uniref:Methyltransferase domain-containing protein n=1 Tax=Percolomonas cosmopolitus TaxID=63605 RepID=A0A7S1KP20_9EUKA